METPSHAGASSRPGGANLGRVCYTSGMANTTPKGNTMNLDLHLDDAPVTIYLNETACDRHTEDLAPLKLDGRTVTQDEARALYEAGSLGDYTLPFSRYGTTDSHPDDVYRRTVTYTASGTVGGILDNAYMLFNVGDPSDERVWQYRSLHRARSLSMGDIITVGETAFLVVEIGFVPATNFTADNVLAEPTTGAQS